jgi:hypothetical protein
MSQFEVTVGNIGKVYAGNQLKSAREAFAEYKDQSKTAETDTPTAPPVGKCEWRHGTMQEWLLKDQRHAWGPPRQLAAATTIHPDS